MLGSDKQVMLGHSDIHLSKRDYLTPVLATPTIKMSGAQKFLAGSVGLHLHSFTQAAEVPASSSGHLSPTRTLERELVALGKLPMDHFPFGKGARGLGLVLRYRGLGLAT